MSKKDYKTIVNGLFWGQENIARHMIAGLRRDGWSFEEIYNHFSDVKMREELITHIAVYTKVVECSLNQIHETLMVNMFFGRTFAESVEAGEYNTVNRNINENNFPFNGPSPKQLLLPVVSGPYRTDADFQDHIGNILPGETSKIILVDMNGKAKPAEALEYMRKRKLRPIETSHLLAIGEQHKEIQRRVKILALGSSCVFLRGRSVLGLDGSDLERSLDIFWYDKECDEHTRFGAIPEEDPSSV